MFNNSIRNILQQHWIRWLDWTWTWTAMNHQHSLCRFIQLYAAFGHLWAWLYYANLFFLSRSTSISLSSKSQVWFIYTNFARKQMLWFYNCVWKSGSVSNAETSFLLWIWLKEHAEKVLGLRAPVHDIRGIPVQGPFAYPQQCSTIRLTHKRASAHQTIKRKNGLHSYNSDII